MVPNINEAQAVGALETRGLHSPGSTPGVMQVNTDTVRRDSRDSGSSVTFSRFFRQELKARKSFQAMPRPAWMRLLQAAKMQFHMLREEIPGISPLKGPRYSPCMEVWRLAPVDFRVPRPRQGYSCMPVAQQSTLRACNIEGTREASPDTHPCISLPLCHWEMPPVAVG